MTEVTNETTTNQNITPIDVEAVDNDTMYVARLEFRSNGLSPEVRPEFTYSHNFPDDYSGEFPCSFLAMRDVAIMMQMMFAGNIEAISVDGDTLDALDELSETYPDPDEPNIH